MKLNKVLDNLMHTRRLKLSTLAKATGVPAQTISNWLSGQNPQNLDQVKKVANYFGVSVDHLCFGETKEMKATEIEEYQDEINAGVFEVVLRRVKKGK